MPRHKEKPKRLQEYGGAGTQGQAQEHPGDHKDGPDDEEPEGVGDHHGDHVAHAELLVVLGGHADDHGQVGVDGGDGVGAGVSDAVDHLGKLRSEAQHHEHGHKDGGENIPLGSAAGHEEVDKGGDQQDGQDQGHTGKPNVIEEGGGVDRDDHGQVGVVEDGDKLGDDKDQHDVAGEGGEGLGHHPGDVLQLFKGAHGEAVDHAHQHEVGQQEGDQAGNEGPIDDGAVVSPEDAVGGDEADEDESDEDDREDARVAQALFLQVGGVPGLVHLAAGELAQTGLNDAVVDDGAHNGQHKAGGDHEVPVVGGGGGVGGVDHLGRLLGDAVQEGVGGGDHQVGGKAGVGGGIAGDEARQGMLAGGIEGGGRQRRDKDDGGLGSNGAVDADKQHGGGEGPGGHAQHGPADGGGEQAAGLGDADGHLHHQHDAQGGKAGEVTHQRAQNPHHAVSGEQALHCYHLAGGGVHRGHPQGGQDGGQDNQGNYQIQKQDEGVGQGVAHPFNGAQDSARFLFQGLVVCHRESDPFLMFSALKHDRSHIFNYYRRNGQGCQVCAPAI